MNDLKQKTLVITAPYFPPFGGGLERYTFEIAKRLKATYNWRVVILASGEYKGKDIDEEVEGLVIHRLSYEHKLSNTPFSFGWKKKIKAILKKEKPNLVNVHMPVPGIGDVMASLVKGKQLVITYHAGSMAKGSFVVDVLIGIYEKIFLQLLFIKAREIVCSSDFVRNEFIRGYRNKTVTITPAVDTKLFVPDQENPSSEKVILFVAGLNRSQQHKGLKDLIDAIKIVKDTIPSIILSIVGDGDMQKEYEIYAKSQGIENIRFEGRLEGEELVHAYQRASIVTLPSYAPAESFGMVLIEGMACKKPVIGTNMGGIPEVVSDGNNGLLVPPADALALAKAIERILLDNSFAKELGENGYEGVRAKFSWDVQAEKYNSMFLNLIKDKV